MVAVLHSNDEIFQFMNRERSAYANIFNEMRSNNTFRRFARYFQDQHIFILKQSNKDDR